MNKSAIMQAEITETCAEVLLKVSSEEQTPDIIGKTNVVISKDKIANLYKGRNLSNKALAQVIKSHTDVLKHGLDTGTEKVFAINTKTGVVIAEEVGSATRVIWEMDKSYRGSLVVVHNHPTDAPFSPTDIHSFSIVRQIRIITVQAHNGKMYMLAKLADKSVTCEEDVLKAILSRIRLKFKNKTYIEQGEIFVEHIARSVGWDFVKGGN